MATKTKNEVIEAPKVASAKAAKESTPKTAKQKSQPTHEQIRQKAYEIFLKTGNHNEHENWIQAEKELLK